MISFVGSDTWVLLALLISEQKDGATLRAIIATADYINHAIPTYEELAGGLARLMRSGYVEKQAGRYRATDVIRMFYRKTTKARYSIWKDWQAVEQFLQSKEVPAAATHLTPSRVLARAAYERAVRTYLA